MSRMFWVIVVGVALVGAWSQANAELPVPSVYPVSWQLKFEYGKPDRIVVSVPGKSTPQAYWYLPFAVSNATNRERMYFPVFEMVTDSGRIIRSDRNTPAAVVAEIRTQQGNRFLQSLTQAAGELRLGEDETKYFAAVWPEAELRMGHFAILVGGLTRKHEEFIRAVFQGSGHRCELLPMPDQESFLLGKEFGNNGQCSPAYFTSGALIQYLRRLEAFMDFLVPRFIQEGKSTLTVSVGCTGGRHRSVALAEPPPTGTP